MDKEGKEGEKRGEMEVRGARARVRTARATEADG